VLTNNTHTTRSMANDDIFSNTRRSASRAIYLSMLVNILLVIVNLITLGSAIITESRYNLYDNCLYEGPILRQLQDVPEMFCAASCLEHTDCDGFLAETDNSCKLLGRGYVINDPDGNMYYFDNTRE
jgi:hypothetical protein